MKQSNECFLPRRFFVSSFAINFLFVFAVQSTLPDVSFFVHPRDCLLVYSGTVADFQQKSSSVREKKSSRTAGNSLSTKKQNNHTSV